MEADNCCNQFKQCHTELYRDSEIPACAKKNRPTASNVKKLLQELDSSNEDDASDDLGPSVAPTAPTKPWLKEFNHYLNTIDELSDGQTIVQWWGVS